MNFNSRRVFVSKPIAADLVAFFSNACGKQLKLRQRTRDGKMYVVMPNEHWATVADDFAYWRR